MFKAKTLAIHAAYRADPTTRAVAVPVYQTASYLLKNTNQAAQIYGQAQLGDQHTYSRYGNPTNSILEQRLATLEGGTGALALASGMAAISYSVLNVVQQGDNIVCSAEIYGSTRNLFAHTFSRWGIETRFVDPNDPENFRRASDKHTRVFYGETIPNPKLNVFPIRDVAKIGLELGIPLIIDNTAAPIICRPIEHGAHIVVHAATKYIGGHGSSIGGVVIDAGTFDWKANSKRFPILNKPDPSYQGVVWSVFGENAYILKMRRTLLRDLGASLSPANAWHFIQGLETLPLRMQEHCLNATRVAAFLKNHAKVKVVNHPSLHTELAGRRATSHLEGGFGGLVGIELAGTLEHAKTFIEALKLFYHIVNIGDSRSLVTHPASTTHAQLSAEARAAAGVSDTYIRLSIGLEDIDDIIADLVQALDQVDIHK
jgi:O-acetylhomoserine (thiol)-lyase